MYKLNRKNSANMHEGIIELKEIKTPRKLFMGNIACLFFKNFHAKDTFHALNDS